MELADQLGVSRTVVREAVKILVTKGLVESKRCYGTRIRQMTMDQISEQLSLLLKTTRESLSFGQLHSVRCVLEESIAGLAAEEATAEDITRLERLMTGMWGNTSRGNLIAQEDADFHHSLALATHNPLLIMFLYIMRDLLREYSRPVLPHLDISADVLPYHDRILEKVVARDVEGARQAMREHLEQIMKNYQKALQQNETVSNDDDNCEEAVSGKKQLDRNDA